MFEACSSSIENILAKGIDDDCCNLSAECSGISSIITNALFSCQASLLIIIRCLFLMYITTPGYMMFELVMMDGCVNSLCEFKEIILVFV